MAFQPAQPKKAVPIFGKQKVNFSPMSPITHLCVSNNKVVIAMQNKVILKIDLREPDKPQEIDLKKHEIDAKLSNMFLDPSGNHLILTFSPKDSVNPAEVMYLGHLSERPKDVPALRTHIITAVAWNQDLDVYTNSSTCPFLLGTSKGSIFEAEVVNGDVKQVKQVYDLGKGSPSVISGLEYFFLPKSTKIAILVATSRRLYQFVGSVLYREERPWFGNIFNSYISQGSEENYKEFGPLSPPGVKLFSDHAVSRLDVRYVPGLAYPSSIAYLTDCGVMVDCKTLNGNSSSASNEDDFISKISLVPYTKNPVQAKEIETGGSSALPKSLVATDFHVLLLYKHSVRALCVLSGDVIFEDNYDEDKGRLLNVICDPVRGTIWCFTEKLIFKYIVTDEERNIWKIFLEKGDFIKATEYSKHDPEKMEVISMKQADHFFAKKDFEMSAMYYAMTKASFEEIALKFVQVDNSHALKTFLMKKMGSLKSNDLAKITALVLWLIEIFLNELGTLRDFGKQDTADYRNLDDEFRHFMTQPLVKDCVSKNKKAVYDLMASHGDKENLIHYTLVMKDYDEVIENSISNGQYQSALTTLLKQKDASLYSRFIPVLLDKDPKSTIDVLITAGRMLNPIKLLPKFSAKLEPDIAIQVTRYLEHCVNTYRVQDQSVHDYLVSLYIHYFPSEKLMEYLEHQGSNEHTVRYDPKFALMMCLAKQLHYPSIHLYTMMGQYEEAVALAIGVDLELAKKVANFPEDDVEMRKKLWLKIAKHVVKEKNNIQQAMDFLQQCDLLKIEDILPFFPDFVTIDHFKEAICASLQEYNQHIQNLKYEMDEATKSAEIITEEIHTVRNRCAIVRVVDKCTVCENTLIIRNFYVFPCGHKFHADCLLSEVYPTLTEPRKKLLHEHQKRLSEVTNSQDSQSTGSSAISRRDGVKSDIDDIIASECIYCGDTMIKLIDTPFIPDDDYNRVQREWE